jgi:hypothetical protein
MQHGFHDAQARYDLPPRADAQSFARDEDRRRLSGTALKAFRSLAATWHLTTEQAAALLTVSTASWERMKRERGDHAFTLNQDQLTRISAMVGVFKGMHLLFADTMADRWPGLRNNGLLFGGQTPIEAMIEGGIPRMLEIRRHVDALRGGL